jgi:uncharacterized protein (UPF0332 family)
MTDAQEGLLDKASRTVRSAEVLAADGDFDAAVSRAYYAMFYAAEALLLMESLTYSSHAGVIAGFGREFTKTGRVPAEYHRFLRESAEARTISDYEIRPGFNHATAAEQIARAIRFVAMAREVLDISAR